MKTRKPVTAQLPRSPKPSTAGAEIEQRVREETAAESVVEFHISPAVSDSEAINAALQKPAARKR